MNHSIIMYKINKLYKNWIFTLDFHEKLASEEDLLYKIFN